MMVILEVYSKHIKVKYKSPLLSKATLLVAMTNILTIALPFVIAYKTGAFWQKTDVFYEQPSVQYNGEYLFVATSTNLSKPLIICSNFKFYKQFLDHSDTCSNIKVRQTDSNYDGKIDSMNFILTAEHENGSRLNSVNLVLPLDYKVKTVCPLEMKSAIIYQDYSQTVFQATEVAVFGDLMLQQSTPLICANQWLNIPVLPENPLTTDTVELENILEAYFKRNVSTHLGNTFTVFKATKTTHTFTINLKINYPEQQIYYKPRLWQIIKNAWIQYFAIYILVKWIISKLEHYIFKNNLVLFYKEDPIQKIR